MARLVTLRTAAIILLFWANRKASGQPCSPNLCSGHGTCESSKDGSTAARQCTCNTGWTGADCSLMVCPYGPAWSDKASGADKAHALAECSNRGYCDRTEGVCRCDAGFEGQECGRRSCPNNCDNHGRCQSMSYFSSVQDPGEGPVYSYEKVWDASMLYGCNCDTGYSGPSCSLRTCAAGDDPLTGTEEVVQSTPYNMFMIAYYPSQSMYQFFMWKVSISVVETLKHCYLQGETLNALSLFPTVELFTTKHTYAISLTSLERLAF